MCSLLVSAALSFGYSGPFLWIFLECLCRHICGLDWIATAVVFFGLLAFKLLPVISLKPFYLFWTCLPCRQDWLEFDIPWMIAYRSFACEWVDLAILCLQGEISGTRHSGYEGVPQYYLIHLCNTSVPSAKLFWALLRKATLSVRPSKNRIPQIPK